MSGYEWQIARPDVRDVVFPIDHDPARDLFQAYPYRPEPDTQIDVFQSPLTVLPPATGMSDEQRISQAGHALMHSRTSHSALPFAST